MRSGRSNGWIRKNHQKYLVANSRFVRSYIVAVGAMSSTARRSTWSGWSSAMRCATRPPRSWPITAKRSNPSATHDLDLIRRHGALGIAGMIRAARRLG